MKSLLSFLDTANRLHPAIKIERLLQSRPQIGHLEWGLCYFLRTFRQKLWLYLQTMSLLLPVWPCSFHSLINLSLYTA